MKKIIFFLLSTVFVISLNAQQFEWAKSYSGSEDEDNNKIFNSAFDSQGNIYILGSFGFGASLDNIRFIDNSGASGYQKAIVVAKLDPNGNLIWRKSIKNGQINICPHWLEVVGDTSVVISTSMGLAGSGRYLWYLDTLLTSTYPIPNDYPFTNTQGTSGLGTCLITFDLDGNVESQHFLQIQQKDSTGAILVDGSGHPYVYDFEYGGAVTPFHIDKNGNIYICTDLIKKWNTPKGEFFRLVVDDQRYFDFEMNLNFNAKIFKFSPNFNTMLWDRDLVVDTIGNGNNPFTFNPWITGISSDNIGNIYVSGYIQHEKSHYYVNDDSTYYRDLIIDPHNPSKKLELETGATDLGYLIKYDTNGNVQWSNQLHGYAQFYVNAQNGFTVGFGSKFYNSVVNEDNNSVYVIGESYVGGGIDSNSYFILDNNDTLRDPANTIFLRYNKETGQYLSHGLSSSNGGYTGSEIALANNTQYIAARNNQVFAQTLYFNNLIGVDTIFHAVNGDYGRGLGLMRWKDDGKVIDVMNFPINTNGDYFEAGSTIMNSQGDLLLFGMFDNTMNLGGISIGGLSRSQAFIAKYSDPSFNQPYIGLNDIDTRGDNGITVYPNPTKGDVYITTQGEKINSFSLYNINGQMLLKSEKLKTTSEKINLSAFSKGVYIIKIITDKNVYSRKIVKN